MHPCGEVKHVSTTALHAKMSGHNSDVTLLVTELFRYNITVNDCLSCAHAWPVVATAALFLCSGEVLVADGQVLPSAFKKVPYGTYGEQYRVQAELAGLKDGEGCPHIVQCYGVFDYQDPVDGKRYLWIAMQ